MQLLLEGSLSHQDMRPRRTQSHSTINHYGQVLYDGATTSSNVQQYKWNLYRRSSRLICTFVSQKLHFYYNWLNSTLVRCIFSFQHPTILINVSLLYFLFPCFEDMCLKALAGMPHDVWNGYFCSEWFEWQGEGSEIIHQYSWSSLLLLFFHYHLSVCRKNKLKKSNLRTLMLTCSGHDSRRYSCFAISSELFDTVQCFKCKAATRWHRLQKHLLTSNCVSCFFQEASRQNAALWLRKCHLTVGRFEGRYWKLDSTCLEQGRADITTP